MTLTPWEKRLLEIQTNWEDARLAGSNDGGTFWGAYLRGFIESRKHQNRKGKTK